MEDRAANMSAFCLPILRDVKAALSLQRRAERAARRIAFRSRATAGGTSNRTLPHGHELALEEAIKEAAVLPKVLLLRYDDLVRRPEEVVRDVHAALRAYTSAHKLSAFIRSHLDTNHTIRELRAISNASTEEKSSAAHLKLRVRLKSEFGTVRSARTCNTLQTMDDSPVCAELLRRMHPLYLC